MNRNLLNLSITLGLGLSFFGLQGCNVTFVQLQRTPSAFPNAQWVQNQIRNQINTINTDWQNNILNADMAAVLKDNDLRIQWLAQQDQNAVNPPQDLNPGQTTILTAMLRDNAGMIRDAVSNNTQWSQTFQNKWDSKFEGSNESLSQCYLDIHIRRQQARLDQAVESGKWSPDQAQDINERLQIVRNMEMDDYRQNSRLYLTADQIYDLRRMIDDNYRYMDFRARHAHSDWNRDHYDSWDTQMNQQPNPYVSSWNQPPAWTANTSRPSTAPQGNYPPPRNAGQIWQPSAQNNSTAPQGGNPPARGWNKIIPTATPLPQVQAPIPTPTPMPQAPPAHLFAPTPIPQPSAPNQPTTAPPSDHRPEVTPVTAAQSPNQHDMNNKGQSSSDFTRGRRRAGHNQENPSSDQVPGPASEPAATNNANPNQAQTDNTPDTASSPKNQSPRHQHGTEGDDQKAPQVNPNRQWDNPHEKGPASKEAPDESVSPDQKDKSTSSEAPVSQSQTTGPSQQATPSQTQTP